MKFVEKGKEGIRAILTESLALLFVLFDRRVPWYARIVVLVPLGYIASPLDLIPDGLLFFGQIDDLIVVRYSYLLLKRLSILLSWRTAEIARESFSHKKEEIG